MSLLSPSVRIALTPGSVAVASGKALKESNVEAPGWAGALKTLGGLLASGAWRGRAAVVLSHHFAHVHCLPAPPLVLKSAEMQGWIRDSLERQYGESSRDWQVAWQMEPPGRPFLVGSMSASALEELEEALRSHSLRPARVEPWLVSAWNRSRRRFGKGQAWFALAEPGRLLLASVAGGAIASLRTSSMAGASAPTLASMVQRETLLTPQAAGAPVWIDSVLLPDDWSAMGRGLSVQPLSAASESLAPMLGS